MPQITRGHAIAFFAFDVGYEVSLHKVRGLISSLPVQPLSGKKQTPNYLQYKNAPQVLFLGEVEMPWGKGQVQATVFDFGAISIAYRWPLQNGNTIPLDELPVLSKTMYDANLENHARKQVESLVSAIRPAIVRPEISEIVEDYYVFVLEGLDQPLIASDLLKLHPAPLAQALRFDTEPLSLERQEETLSKAISYYEKDLVVIDWNTAIIYDVDYTDTVNVLELLNVELLETRYIDAQLDQRVLSYEAVLQRHTPWFIPFYSPYRKAIDELAELRIESSLLAERVENALKLVGDQYLARVHAAVSDRFNLHEWDTAISRKLDIIDYLYELMTDRLRSGQSQTLELVIIILILIEIMMGLLSH